MGETCSKDQVVDQGEADRLIQEKQKALELHRPEKYPQAESVIPVKEMAKPSERALMREHALQPFEGKATEDEMFEELGVQRLGIYKYENGDTYNGHYLLGKKEGRGKQVEHDGSIYDGYWRENAKCGFGRMIHADGDWYEGEFKNGVQEGKGVYYSSDGVIISGDWINNQLNGEGEEIHAHRLTYQGGFKNSLKNGKGVIEWTDGTKYEGDFVDNELEGKGKYTWEDGRVYEGDWKRSKMEGKGKYTWTDGRYYEGAYQDGLKHGRGLMNWYGKRFYTGEWERGKQHGTGYEITEGEVKKGKFEEGVMIVDETHEGLVEELVKYDPYFKDLKEDMQTFSPDNAEEDDEEVNDDPDDADPNQPEDAKRNIAQAKPLPGDKNSSPAVKPRA